METSAYFMVPLLYLLA